MPTLYFNAAIDNAWSTVGNWWQENTFTIPASSIPSGGDIVYIEGNVYTGPSTAVTLAALYVAQMNSGATLGSSGAGISTTGDLTVGKSSYLTGHILSANMTIGGTAYFHAFSVNQTTLTVSLAVFYQNSGNQYSGLITGNAIFQDVSANTASIGGNATFSDSSSNASTVTGNATFNDISGNYGTITGNATFNDESLNSTVATIGGNATFNDQSYNEGTVTGSASVYYPVPRPLGGTVTGTITYYGYPEFYFNAAVDGTWNNHLNWWRNSGFSIQADVPPTNGSMVFIEAHLTSGPTVAVTLAALGIAQINNAATLGSSGAGISTTGDLTVGVASTRYGRIDNANLTIGGTANFYGSNGGNSSTLTVSSANFYEGTSNYGTAQGSSSNGAIVGAAAFYDTAVNYCTIDGSATFNNNSYNASGATVNFGSTFNDYSYNASGATVDATASFYNHSYNLGLISGDASVYSPVTRPLGGTVTGTITYYPPIFTLYFNAKVDGTWDNLGNWWQDKTFSVPASAIPANGDTAYIEANLTTGPSTAVTLAALYIAQINNGVTLGSSGSGIAITGDLTVGYGVYLYGRINSANLTIGGTANFYGGNGGNSSTLTVSLANFYLGSSNYGTGQGSSSNGVITGNAVFHDNAKNYCSIGGNATFNDISGNNSGGSITGSSTFNDSSYNASGATVGGNSTFKDNSTNLGHVSGNASVYYPVSRPIGGTVSGSTTYINYP